MKSKLFFWAMSLLSSASVFAADLYVRDLGAGGAYPTITAAIAAATNGDRIIVRPKTGNAPYIESFTIDKSLTFVSEIDFTKYLVQGSILVNPGAGRTVTIHNLSIIGNFTKNTDIPAISGGRFTVNLINSIFTGNVDLSSSYTSLNMSGCTVTITLRFQHGKICANTLKFAEVVGDGTLDNTANSPIYFIANKLVELDLLCNTYAFHVLNNYFNMQSSANVTSVRVYSIKSSSNNFITNNTIVSTLISDSNTNLINITDALHDGAISIKNNILKIGANSSYFSIKKTSNPDLTVYVDYNMSPTNLGLSGVFIESFNSSNASININDFDGVTTGQAIDAGDPNDEYSDLDLTPNDMGTGGGSDTIINYWSSTSTQPQIFFLDVPARIFQGTTTFQAEANGYSK